MNATDDIGFPVPLEVPLDPLTDMSTFLKRHILILVDIYPITSAYLSLLFSASMPAALWRALLQVMDYHAPECVKVVA